MAEVGERLAQPVEIIGEAGMCKITLLTVCPTEVHELIQALLDAMAHMVMGIEGLSPTEPEAWPFFFGMQRAVLEGIKMHYYPDREWSRHSKV